MQNYTFNLWMLIYSAIFLAVHGLPRCISSVAFSSEVCGGVQYIALLAIQKCGCPHSTMGYGHFSLQTPIPECMCTGQQLSTSHTTLLGCRESPLTHPSTLPHPAISQHNNELKTSKWARKPAQDLYLQIDSSLLNVNTAWYYLMFNVIM